MENTKTKNIGFYFYLWNLLMSLLTRIIIILRFYKFLLYLSEIYYYNPFQRRTEYIYLLF